MLLQLWFPLCGFPLFRTRPALAATIGLFVPVGKLNCDAKQHGSAFTIQILKKICLGIRRLFLRHIKRIVG